MAETNPILTFLTDVRDTHSSGVGVKETSYYPALSNLFNALGKTLKPRVRCIVHPHSIGAGLPDGALITSDQKSIAADPLADGLIPSRGVIEVKPPGDDAHAIAKSAQVQKYIDKYGLVLVTTLRQFVIVVRVDGKPKELESFTIWSTDWFRDPNRSIEGVICSISLAEARPIEESVLGVPLTTDIPVVSEARRPAQDIQRNDPPLIQRKYKAGVPYHKASCTGNRDHLVQPRCSGPLSDLIVRIVEAEYPIHEDLLAERLKEVCGIARASSSVVSNIGEGIHFAIKRSEIERRRQKDFLWKSGAQLATFRLPGDGVKRSLDRIHRDEIALAILYLVEDQFGLLRSELGRSVVKLFGIERSSAEAADYVLEVADELVEQNHLSQTDNGFAIVA